MKSPIKSFTTIVAAALGALIPIYFAYQLWAYLISLVPASEWAALAKVAITVAVVFLGGGLTIWLAVIIGALVAGVVAAFLK